MAWVTDWSYRIPLTIDAARIGADLASFPVYVSGANLGAHFWANVLANGNDVRVTASDGETVLNGQLVGFSQSAETMEFHFLAPALTAYTDALFYLYYGNSGAAGIAAAVQQAVWSSVYLALWHLGESAAGTGTADVYTDATGHGYDGDDYVDPGGKVGKLYATGGETFDGSNDYIVPTGIASASGTYTFSWWVKSTQGAGAANRMIFDTQTGRIAHIWETVIATAVQAVFDGVYRYFSAPPNDGNWHYQAIVLDGVGGTAKLYEDGGAAQSASYTARNIGATTRIGSSFSGGADSWFGGVLDEFRIAPTALSAAWRTAEYANQSSPTTFYRIGAPQSQYTLQQHGSIRTRSRRSR